MYTMLYMLISVFSWERIYIAIKVSWLSPQSGTSIKILCSWVLSGNINGESWSKKMWRETHTFLLFVWMYFLKPLIKNMLPRQSSWIIFTWIKLFCLANRDKDFATSLTNWLKFPTDKSSIILKNQSRIW